MEQLFKAIWLEYLFLTDMVGEDMRRVMSRSVRARWVRDCKRSGYLHPSV